MGKKRKKDTASKVHLALAQQGLALNMCVVCKHTWSDKPGGYAYHKKCSGCESVYWIWKNYNEFENE